MIVGKINSWLYTFIRKMFCGVERCFSLDFAGFNRESTF